MINNLPNINRLLWL